jgi:thioredoxin reductase (NADPH)
MSAPTTRDLATALGIDLWCLSGDSRCDLLVVGAGPAGLAAAVATSVPGVFAAGDVRAGSVKRVASAVGEGSVVISAVHSHLAGTTTF